MMGFIIIGLTGAISFWLGIVFMVQQIKNSKGEILVEKIKQFKQEIFKKDRLIQELRIQNEKLLQSLKELEGERL